MPNHAVWQPVEVPITDDPAVVGEDPDLRGQGAELRHDLRDADPRRLQEREAEETGALGDRRRGEGSAATGGPVRRGDDPDESHPGEPDEELERRETTRHRHEPAAATAVDVDDPTAGDEPLWVPDPAVAARTFRSAISA